jgi:hypothetical protein
MNPISPNDRVEFVLLPPASPIKPDGNGLPAGFSLKRIKRLFSSRAVLSDPPQAEGVIHSATKAERPLEKRSQDESSQKV